MSILKNNYSADGHWVTINGNHVFIEDSSGGKVLKGRVEKTDYPPPLVGRRKDRLPDSGGGSSGGEYLPEKKKTIVDFLKTIAPLVIHEIFSNASAKSNNNYTESRTYRSPQYKTQIDNAVRQAKTGISQEYDKLQKMIDAVSAMPKSSERDSKWQEVLSKGAELDEAKAVINNIEAFNNHDMPEKIVDEVNKLFDALPKNYVKNSQAMEQKRRNKKLDNNYSQKLQTSGYSFIYCHHS